jgi:hypothetical protein
MRYLCLLLVILVVYWYCKNDTIEGNWVFKEGEFKKSNDRQSGDTVKIKVGSIAEGILSNKVMLKEIQTKKLESKIFKQFKKVGWTE